MLYKKLLGSCYRS